MDYEMDNPRLCLILHREGGMSVSYFEAPAVRFQIEVDSVKLTPEVEDLLARLLAHPIIG